MSGLVPVAFVSMSLAVATPSSAAGTSTSVPVPRLAGSDAIGTALTISQAEFPGPGSAGAAVLARSDFFSDALAGGPLAAKVQGPLLITPGSGLDPRVQAEIQRVLPTGRPVYILGGPLALSPAIDSALQSLGYLPTRVEGVTEFATAVEIARQLGDPPVVFEATGLGFQDALSAVPAAIAAGGAIVLTNGSTQAPETAAYLTAHPGDTRYAIGGPLAAYGADPTATPVYGQDLYGTSAAVADTFFPGATAFGAATGTFFADALAGGVFMGTRAARGPVLLVQPSGPLPSPIGGYLSAGVSRLTQGNLFGGPFAVGNDVLFELEWLGTMSPLAAPSAPPPTIRSSNWSGYVAGGTYRAVTGRFTVPSLSSYVPDSTTAEWVGLDGVPGTNGLIQAGVDQLPYTSTTTIIVPWWEILPAPQTFVTSMVVNTGDVFTVSIVQLDGTVWQIALTDETNGQRFTTDQVYTGSGSSADWVVEALTVGSQQSALAPYTPPVTFDNLGIAGVQGPLSTILLMQNGVPVSTPSSLTSSGFSVAYGSAPPPAPQARTGTSAATPGALVGIPPPPGFPLPVIHSTGSR